MAFRILISNSTRKGYLAAGLAPYYRTLNKSGVHAVDDSAKVIIAGTMCALEALSELTYEKVLVAELQGPLLESDTTSQINCASLLNQESSLNLAPLEKRLRSMAGPLECMKQGPPHRKYCSSRI
jgi:hypothetical protein